MVKHSVLGLTAVFLFFAHAAHAVTITQFSNRANFDASVGPTQLEDFTSTSHFPITSGVLNQFTTEAGLNVGDIEAGVTFSTPVGTGNFFNIDAGGGYSGGFLDSLTSTGTRALTITFDSPVSAFGFDTNNLMGTAFDITINFVSGGPFSDTVGVSVGPSELTFFGFQSDLADITSAVIQGNNNNFNYALDNFSFGGESGEDTPVPEPGAVTLFGLGLAGLGLMRRCRRRSGN